MIDTLSLNQLRHEKTYEQSDLGDHSASISLASFGSKRTRNDFLRIMNWSSQNDNGLIFTSELNAPDSLSQIFPECRVCAARAIIYNIRNLGLLESAGKGVWAPTRLAYQTYRHLLQQGIDVSQAYQHKINGPHGV